MLCTIYWEKTIIMLYCKKAATRNAVIEHFENHEINGVGKEMANGTIVWYKYNKYEEQYLTFVSQEDGTTFKFSGSSSSNLIQYSLDNGDTWSSLAHNTNSSAVNSGDTIMFKATGLTINSSSGIGQFSSTGQFEAEGNVMSLHFGDSFSGQTSLAGKASAFTKLFSACTGLTTAKNMSFPATTLSGSCYYYMFNGCTSLTTAPLLPATTLATSCYRGMFRGCTSLTTVPELPATTLANYCYAYMFAGCTNLTTAPVLPATTLADRCYESMFAGCTSLTSAPELPAATLANSGYSDMFSACTSLITAPELPATSLASNCYGGMFQGCTSLTTAPSALPATTLANCCYAYMFAGCTNLTTAPELPATSLYTWCYYNMFSGCNSLNYVKCLASTGMTNNFCLSNWLNGVASSGTFVKSPNATTGDTVGASQWATGSTSGIPSGWEVQDATS